MLIISITTSKTFGYKSPSNAPLLSVTAKIKFNDTTVNNTAIFNLNAQLIRALEYPKECRDQKLYGKVIVKFEITADKKIQQTEPMQSPDDMFTNEVVNVINN